jgi:hypothetical protein
MERIPRVYTIADLPSLHLTLVNAWQTLRRGRWLYMREHEIWSAAGRRLREAVAPLVRRALPSSFDEADAFAHSLPSHFNVRAHRAVQAAFEAELDVAEFEGRLTDEWLLAHAPVSVRPVPWQEELDAALRERGLPAEGGPLVARSVLDPDSLSPELADCLPYCDTLAPCLGLLVTIMEPRRLEELRRRLGPRPLHPYLLCTVDFAVKNLDNLCDSRLMRDIELGTSSYPVFARMREALLGWDTTREMPEAVRLAVSGFLTTIGVSGPWSRV